MRQQFSSGTLLAACLLALTVLPASGQTPEPNSPRWKGVQALAQFFGTDGDESLSRFAEEKIAPGLREKLGEEKLLAELRRLRNDGAGLELTGARPRGRFEAIAEFGDPSSGELVIPFRLEQEPPHRFLQIAFIGADREGEEAPSAPLTWETLEDRLDQAAAAGFAGSVLVMRDGEVALDRGYGLANRKKKIPNRPDTIYAIGSTPIDFTKAGILLLAQEGRLSLSDPITKYFDSVPPDKTSITLDHLMTGQSGLRNFHGRPGDPNPDHHWINRDEAMRRIFEGELLFAPGEGRRHSHSAWGVLAAVIEIVSEQTYPEFTRARLLKPAGMNDTGFFGESYPQNRMAIGYGDSRSGKINAPPYWGPTSWLVVGSGGQYSTTGDMYRWHRALADGKILAGEYAKRYWGGAGDILAGGDQFGFEIVYTQGPDTMMVIVSNTGGPGRMKDIEDLGQELAMLISLEGRSAPKFSLGIQMAIESSDGVFVDGVRGGSAAERDGLRAGDRLLSANGQKLGEDPLRVLDPLLATGSPIRFEIERQGTRQEITVTPDPR